MNRVAGLADTYAANHDSRSGQSQHSGHKSFNGNSARHAPHHPRDTNVSLSPRTYGRGRGNYGPSQPGRGGQTYYLTHLSPGALTGLSSVKLQ